MADDILDAAQIAIDTAAKQSGTPPPPPEPMISSLGTPAAVSNVDSSLPAEPAPEPVVDKAPTELPIESPAKDAMVSELLSGATTVSSTVVSPSKPPIPTHHDSLPKKKSGKGMLLMVLATLLLTLPVAVYYISQQNGQLADFRSKATCTQYCGNGGSCSGNRPCANGYTCSSTTSVSGTCAGNSDPNGSNGQCGRGADSNAPVCCTSSCPESNRVCEGSNRLECKTGGVHCTIDANGCNDTTNPVDTPIPTAVPTTPVTTPICQNIKIYKDGVQVTPSTLVAGDTVVLAVKGSLTPTNARFRVNGGTWQETATKNASDEFTLTYVVPSDVVAFVIEAEVFTDGAWR